MQQIIGDRVRQLRLAVGMTQTELSEAIGSTGNALISRIENSRAPLDPTTVTRLAVHLGCREHFLSSAPLEPSATRPWLRAYADAPARTVESVVADNHLAAETFAQLELRRVSEKIPRFQDGMDDLHDPWAIERHAEAVRAAARLPEGQVVQVVMRAAERLGCVILPLPDELGRHLGLSQYIDGTPIIRASRPRTNVPGDRQRFTLAHELAHLALHDGMAPPETADEARHIEQQAHRFAGAFLTPRDELLSTLHELDAEGRVTLPLLQQLKSRWGVSIKMLVVRLRQLNVIEDAQATALYKQISKRGWNTAEPVSVPHEKAAWLPRALAMQWPGDEPEVAAAEAAGLLPRHVRRWLDWSEVVEEAADVSPIETRKRRSVAAARERGKSAEIHRLRPRN